MSIEGSTGKEKRPTALIGKGALRPVPIWKFKDITHQNDPELDELRLRLNDFHEPYAEEVTRQIMDAGLGVENALSYQFIGNRVITTLQRYLIDPKVVTGQVDDLSIVSVEEDELPQRMVIDFTRKLESLSPNTRIDGFNRYYKIAGHVKLGQKLSSVAMGICIAPKANNMNGWRMDNPMLDFRSMGCKFNLREAGENDRSAWRASIAIGRANAVGGINNAFKVAGWSGKK